MENNTEDRLGQDEANEVNKSSDSSTHPILTFLFFMLVVNQLNKKTPSSTGDQDWTEDDYTVTMEKNPAFPLEEDEQGEKVKKTPILKLENSNEIFNMVDRLKPYMSEKNRHTLSIFEKWKVLMEDMNTLTQFERDNSLQSMSKSQPKDVVNFLSDIQPFVDQEYHPQMRQFSEGMNSVMNIQENIMNLQKTFDGINTIKDNTQKVNTLVDALQPFMGETQKKTVGQFKNISQVMNMMKMAESMKGSTEQSEDNSNLMDLLDMFSSTSDDKIEEVQQEGEILDKEDVQYEEVFEELESNNDEDVLLENVKEDFELEEEK